MPGENLDRETFETILDAKIGPLVDAIDRLEKASEAMVEILQNQARQDAEIAHLQKQQDKVDGELNDLYTRLREAENRVGNRAWDVVKLVLTAVVSAIGAALFVGSRSG